MADEAPTPRQRIEAEMTRQGLTVAAIFIPWSRSRMAGERMPSLNWRVSLCKVPGVHAYTKPAGEHCDCGCKVGRAIVSTDYTAGMGHAPAFKAPVKDLGGMNCIMRDAAIREECETGRPYLPRYAVTKPPIMPDPCDVIHSLVTDADVLNSGDFEEWAGEYGYDPDSRKAEALYRDCLAMAVKLRNGLTDDGLSRLRAACEDY